MISYISAEDVVSANKVVTAEYDQPHFVMNIANLEHALESTIHYAEKEADGEEKLFKKAAFLFYHLAHDAHAFTDGNKRTALSAANAFLGMNGWDLDFEGDEKQVEVAKVAKEAAEGKLSVSFLAKWLKKSAKKNKVFP